MIINSISEQYNIINGYANSTPNNDYETIKNWENILSSEITALNLHNAEFKIPELQESINKQQFVEQISSHVEEYYKALMNDFLANGSREGEAKKFLSKLQQVKALSKEFDFKSIEIEVNKAIEEHKVKWN